NGAGRHERKKSARVLLLHHYILSTTRFFIIGLAIAYPVLCFNSSFQLRIDFNRGEVVENSVVQAECEKR
ncbi:hypothetical protein, partial [Gloeocapsopsis dulcis]